ncbi:hypothetical protein RF11_07148 [Thelohanellus kitauei]|uniref:Peptidase A1 domain-containing protein n=1 Tax=Thelohanellus kitauei TaxID=669202 RepID=A0A0C2JLT7_THEKT|nr:hypothetical protein RF11_07148 [Thelohanellus kitauei]
MSICPALLLAILVKAHTMKEFTVRINSHIQQEYQIDNYDFSEDQIDVIDMDIGSNRILIPGNHDNIDRFKMQIGLIHNHYYDALAIDTYSLALSSTQQSMSNIILDL